MCTGSVLCKELYTPPKTSSWSTVKVQSDDQIVAKGGWGGNDRFTVPHENEWRPDDFGLKSPVIQKKRNTEK